MKVFQLLQGIDLKQIFFATFNPYHAAVIFKLCLSKQDERETLSPGGCSRLPRDKGLLTHIVGWSPYSVVNLDIFVRPSWAGGQPPGGLPNIFLDVATFSGWTNPYHAAVIFKLRLSKQDERETLSPGGCSRLPCDKG